MAPGIWVEFTGILMPGVIETGGWVGVFVGVLVVVFVVVKVGVLVGLLVAVLVGVSVGVSVVVSVGVSVAVCPKPSWGVSKRPTKPDRKTIRPMENNERL